MRKIDPSIFVLAKLSYFEDMKNSEMLFGTQIEYALEHMADNQLP